MRRIGRFFLYLFGSIGALITFFAVSAIVFAVSFSEPEPELPERIVLRLNLDRGISDSRSDDSWRKLRGDKTVHLYDVVMNLAAAARDDRVVGLAIRLGGARIGLAHAQELREAIGSFRAHGKFAMAFAQTFGGFGSATSEYYLASSADEIWMQPSGQLALLGIGLEIPFLKDALDKLGVKPEFEQRHEYKSAIELMTHSTMSAPARESLTKIVESWMGQVVSGIAADRNISRDALRATIDRAPLLAEEARASALIDKFGYREDYAKAAIERGGEGAVGLDFTRYAAKRDTPEETGPDVALIYGVGPIQSGEAENSPFGSEKFTADSVAGAIEAATDDEKIAAIILRIDSPGGSYIGSDIVRRAVIRAKEQGKPVIASMGEYGASGGYFVAMGADKIVALPGTLTGSIGVFGGKLATIDFWTKLGINWTRVGDGANAGMWSQIFPFSPSAAARHRALIDFVYEDFTKKVAADRGLVDGKIDSVARGRVWSGADAQRVGLVDALGGYAVAAGLVREALALEPDAPLNIVVLPEPLSPLDRLRDAIAVGVPFSRALAEFVVAYQPNPFESLVRQLELVIGDARVFLPPAGLLQLPPFRLAP